MLKLYSDCQKNVAVFKRFFLQPYTRLCRNSLILNIIMKSGIELFSLIIHTNLIQKQQDVFRCTKRHLRLTVLERLLYTIYN